MFGLCLLLILLWLILVSFATTLFSMEGVRQQQFAPLVDRSYNYGAAYPQYPVIPFFEPIIILAGLAFLAYIIQVIQALYLGARAPTANLLGGLVSSLVPTRDRIDDNEDVNYKYVIDAIKIAKLLEKSNRDREPAWVNILRKSSTNVIDDISNEDSSTSKPTILVNIAKNPPRK